MMEQQFSRLPRHGGLGMDRSEALEDKMGYGAKAKKNEEPLDIYGYNLNRNSEYDAYLSS